MNKLLLILLFAEGHLAAFSTTLLKRQLVPIPCDEQGLKDCGVGCIDLTWTCCPSGAGGCAPSDYCVVGDNGEDACCLDGEICVGPGGAITSSLISTITIETTSTIFGEITSTVLEETTSTAEETASTVEETSTTAEETTAVEIPPIEGTDTVTFPITTTVTPIPLPTPILNGTTTTATTSGVTVPTNAATPIGYSASSLLGGLLAGVAALLF